MDYRDFLYNYLSEQKRKDKKITYRYISNMIGLKSSGYLSLIINGKRTMSVDVSEKFSDFFGFKKMEKKYFSTLIFYNKEKNPIKKQKLFKRLLDLKKNSNYYRLNQEQIEYFSKWYYAPIREILIYSDRGMDIDYIYTLFNGEVAKSEIMSACEFLINKEFVSIEARGVFNSTDKIITASGLDNEYLLTVRRELILKSISAMDEFSANERHISSSTLAFSNKSYKILGDKIDELRRYALQIAQNDDEVDKIYQLNVQLFPLTGNLK